MHNVSPHVALLASAVLGLSACSNEPSASDSVGRAMDANREKFPAEDMRAASEFLVDMADARMMGTREGEVARDRGVSEEVRAYGEAMVRDQAILLAEIRALADQKGIVLPERISNPKSEGLEDLMDEAGADVDSKFMRMICIDHERDVGEFRDAARLADPDVSAFAARRLPMIEQHLADAKAIKDRL